VREVKISSLVTEDGQWLPVQMRTAAIIAKVYRLQEKIEKTQQGELEIVVYFKNSSIRVSVRDVSDLEKIE
jgi:hypothetical protein